MQTPFVTRSRMNVEICFKAAFKTGWKHVVNLKLSVWSAGSEFQIVGASWQNARLPKTFLAAASWSRQWSLSIVRCYCEISWMFLIVICGRESQFWYACEWRSPTTEPGGLLKASFTTAWHYQACTNVSLWSCYAYFVLLKCQWKVKITHRSLE